MKKIIISGGPHSGKTTLLKALQTEFPDAYFVDEPAETVINRELTKQKADVTYAPIVPWIDYTAFAPNVTQESLALENEIPQGSGLIFQDRSLVDTIAYCRLNDFEIFIPEVTKHIKNAHYSLAFFCEPVGSYMATEVRRETIEEAKRTHEELVQAYEQSGIRIIHLPVISISERVQIIKDELNHGKII